VVSPDKQGYSIKNKLSAWSDTIISSGFIIIIIIHHSSFIIHHSSIINHHGKIHQLVDLYLRFAHMWVIFKGSLGHNSMVHWCSIPVEQGDAGSNIFDISGRLLDLPHTVPQHKCSYEFVTQIIKISKHFIIQNITKQELLYMYINIYIFIYHQCVCFTNVSLSNHVPSLATKRYYPMGPWDDTIGVFSIG
jgi:hypothetical protein